MRIFFIAHPGQIDGLCCGRSLLSVYNVAFALHCPDPATPRGNWFLPLRCPFTSLSSLVVFPFSLIPSSFFPFSLPPSPSALSSLCTFFHTHTNVFTILLRLHLSSSFISFALLPSSLPLALLSGLLVLLLHTVSQSLQPVFLPTHSAPSFIFRHCHSVLYFPLSPVFTPSICIITPSSPFQSSLPVCLSLSSPISYFLPLLSCLRLCRQVLSLPPLLRLSLCIGSCPQPTAWLTNGLSLQRHHITISRPLYLTSYSYFIAVTSADCCWRRGRPLTNTHMCIFGCNFSVFLMSKVFSHISSTPVICLIAD